ncbi:hypothetical protein MUG91_G82n59 [Manis pentadactyla]|nr:hypothetical protein MUG91_G82n59 [Manis pentadactyla]
MMISCDDNMMFRKESKEPRGTRRIRSPIFGQSVWEAVLQVMTLPVGTPLPANLYTLVLGGLPIAHIMSTYDQDAEALKMPSGVGRWKE